MEREYAKQYVNQILYSTEMKELQRMPSPHRGFANLAEAARTVQKMVNYAAVQHHMNEDYCELLALLYFFDSDVFSFVSEEEILFDDLKKLRNGTMCQSALSKEVRCVGKVIRIVFEIRGMDPKELERCGGFSIAVCKSVDELSL